MFKKGEEGLRSIAALKLLLKGHEVTIQGVNYCLDEGNNLCTEGTIKRPEAPLEKVWLRADYSLGNAITLFESMSDDEFTRVCANITLTIQRGKRY